MGICLQEQKRRQDGQVRWKNLRCTKQWNNFLESMEKQLNSSVIFSQDSQHCKFFSRSRTTCNARTSNRNKFLTEPNSCQCSTTLSGKREILEKLVFRIQVHYPVEDFLGIDGEAIKLEWNLSQDSRHCKIYNGSRMTCKVKIRHQNNSLTESSSCQCSTTSIGQNRNNEETCTSNSEQVKWYAQRFQKGHWTFIGPGDEWKWYVWNKRVPTRWKMKFHSSKDDTELPGDERGILKQAKGKTSILFNAEMTNSELLLKIKICANQLSIYGAVAYWCYQYGAKEDEEAGNPSSHEQNVNKMNSVVAHEVNSLVSTPRLVEFLGNRLSTEMKTINDMPFHSQLCILCDLVW